MICRLCLKEISDQDAYTLFSNNEGENPLLKMISKYLHLEVHKVNINVIIKQI